MDCYVPQCSTSQDPESLVVLLQLPARDAWLDAFLVSSQLNPSSTLDKKSRNLSFGWEDRKPKSKKICKVY